MATEYSLTGFREKRTAASRATSASRDAGCTSAGTSWPAKAISPCASTNERVLTTPTCMNKGMLAPEDLVIIDLEGRHVAGDRKASSELAMHLLFYRMRPDVHAICHAHPPTATGFAVAGRALDQALLPEVIVGLGQIPLVKYGTPGTPELSAAIEPYVPHYDALLLANHGAVTCGPDLITAFFRMETIEHFAKITLAAEMAGTPDAALQPRSGEADGRADPILRRAAAGRRRGAAVDVRRW